MNRGNCTTRIGITVVKKVFSSNRPNRRMLKNRTIAKTEYMRVTR
jgi:hypothetical protein